MEKDAQPPGEGQHRPVRKPSSPNKESPGQPHENSAQSWPRTQLVPEAEELGGRRQSPRGLQTCPSQEEELERLDPVVTSHGVKTLRTAWVGTGRQWPVALSPLSEAAQSTGKARAAAAGSRASTMALSSWPAGPVEMDFTSQEV